MKRGFRDSSEAALVEGDVVASSYHVRREITRVHTGAVYEAHDTLLDRLVAIKLAWRDPGTPSLVSEARRCAAVRDPCSVQIHGMGMHQGVEYAIAERVVGKLLADEIDRMVPVSSTCHACASSSPRSRACTTPAPRSA